MLGEQIKRCREKRGFTQEQLAEKIGVSIETISSIERGIKMPRLQNFVAIANQLGVSADELLQDELDFGFIAEANALSKKLEELSRADRKRILETMNLSDLYRLAENRNKSFVFQWIRKIASDWRNDRSRQELTGI